jgi:hypothetical protein
LILIKPETQHFESYRSALVRLSAMPEETFYKSEIEDLDKKALLAISNCQMVHSFRGCRVFIGGCGMEKSAERLISDGRRELPNFHPTALVILDMGSFLGSVDLVMPQKRCAKC